MIPFDDCYMCNWIVRGSGRDKWCGAGRPEFHDDHATEPCVARSPKAELWFSQRHSPELVLTKQLGWWHEDGREEWFNPKARAWIEENMPDTVISPNEDPDDRELGVHIMFTSPENAVLFKLFWT